MSIRPVNSSPQFGIGPKLDRKKNEATKPTVTNPSATISSANAPATMTGREENCTTIPIARRTVSADGSLLIEETGSTTYCVENQEETAIITTESNNQTVTTLPDGSQYTRTTHQVSGTTPDGVNYSGTEISEVHSQTVIGGSDAVIVTSRPITIQYEEDVPPSSQTIVNEANGVTVTISSSEEHISTTVTVTPGSEDTIIIEDKKGE